MEMIDISGWKFSLEDLSHVLEVVIGKADVNYALLELSSLVHSVSQPSHVSFQLLLPNLRLLVIVQQDIIFLSQVRNLRLQFFSYSSTFIL